jgi:hypothetical protein
MLYPEHLGEAFVHVYSEMKNDRTSFKKGTPENAMHTLECSLSLIDNLIFKDVNCILK